MSDPVVTPAAAIAANIVGAAVAVPVLTMFGVPLGLEANVLIAGLVGAIAAIVLLDSVPGSTDTLSELLRTTLKRITVAALSALIAGYAAPVIGPLFSSGTQLVPVTLLASLVVGASAQQSLRLAIDWLQSKAKRSAEGANP